MGNVFFNYPISSGLDFNNTITRKVGSSETVHAGDFISFEDNTGTMISSGYNGSYIYQQCFNLNENYALIKNMAASTTYVDDNSVYETGFILNKQTNTITTLNSTLPGHIIDVVALTDNTGFFLVMNSNYQIYFFFYTFNVNNYTISYTPKVSYDTNQLQSLFGVSYQTWTHYILLPLNSTSFVWMFYTQPRTSDDTIVESGKIIYCKCVYNNNSLAIGTFTTITCNYNDISGCLRYQKIAQDTFLIILGGYGLSAHQNKINYICFILTFKNNTISILQSNGISLTDNDINILIEYDNQQHTRKIGPGSDPLSPFYCCQFNSTTIKIQIYGFLFILTETSNTLNLSLSDSITFPYNPYFLGRDIGSNQYIFAILGITQDYYIVLSRQQNYSRYTTQLALIHHHNFIIDNSYFIFPNTLELVVSSSYYQTSLQYASAASYGSLNQFIQTDDYIYYVTRVADTYWSDDGNTGYTYYYNCLLTFSLMIKKSNSYNCGLALEDGTNGDIIEIYPT